MVAGADVWSFDDDLECAAVVLTKILSREAVLLSAKTFFLQFVGITAGLQTLLLTQMLQLLRRTLLAEIKDQRVYVLDSRFNVVYASR